MTLRCTFATGFGAGLAAARAGFGASRSAFFTGFAPTDLWPGAAVLPFTGAAARLAGAAAFFGAGFAAAVFDDFATGFGADFTGFAAGLAGFTAAFFAAGFGAAFATGFATGFVGFADFTDFGAGFVGLATGRFAAGADLTLRTTAVFAEPPPLVALSAFPGACVVFEGRADSRLFTCFGAEFLIESL